MSTIFEFSPKFAGLNGDKARVATLHGRVVIRSIDTTAAGVATIAMTPDQARALAAGISVAANEAEARE